MKLVVINEDGTHKEPSYEDLKEHHPRCRHCFNQRGVHGKIGKDMVFCKVWDKMVDKNGYCSNIQL